jgi:hypothetical protein
MSLTEQSQEHPVLTGTVCFLVLAGILVGGMVGYKRMINNRARGQVAGVVSETSKGVRQLDAALEKARAQLEKSGPFLSPEDRIKANQTIVIVDENMPVYCMVLSNALLAVERNEFAFFRSAFDGPQQSNLLRGLKRDRQALEQVVQYCRERERRNLVPALR